MLGTKHSSGAITPLGSLDHFYRGVFELVTLGCTKLVLQLGNGFPEAKNYVITLHSYACTFIVARNQLVLLAESLAMFQRPEMV